MAHHSDMVKTLRATGHRLTPQRESVLAIIAESNGHLTADDILEQVRVRYSYLNKSAVYRSLELLVDLGLVTITDLGQGRAEYELHNHPHHHHLVCRQCGQIKEIEHRSFVSLQKNLRSRYGFEANLDHFAIFGTCRKCSVASRKN